MTTIKYIISIVIIAFTFSCNQQSSEVNKPEEENQEHTEVESDEEVHLVQKQMDVMEIKLGGFQYLNLSTTVKANGQLELPPQNKASLSTIMGGRVKSVTIIEGDYVTKGQILAQLEHPDFVEIQEQYLASKSQLSFLEKEYKRKMGLYADSINSARVSEQAEANYYSALAKTNGLKERLQIMDIDINAVERGELSSTIPIKSPINGYVKEVYINLGKYVSPQEEMIEIVDNKHIHIDLMIYEKDINKVKEGQKVIFSLYSSPDVVYSGNIFSTGKSFDREINAVVVHAEINNKTGELLPGMYVDARVITNEEKVRAVPNNAIVKDGSLNYIFVLKPNLNSDHKHDDFEEHSHDNNQTHDKEYVFIKMEVNTGANDIGFTEVVPAYNLPEHTQLVTNGAFYLLAEMKKGEGGHGHHH